MVQTHSKMWYSEATGGDWQIDGYICTSYHMATRALAKLSPEGAKRPRAIN